ncbi:hypothetical protein [Rhizobium sp. rho-13.1]|uniref:hypothetical protein n=1 Tax=Rhizobium sp. rho-13.1 TaxID=2506431 RepID=UPI001FCE9ACA|nr:hypothetical protein [Rhizobium sp. rho-13.1]
MKTIDELVAYFDQAKRECDDQIARLANTEPTQRTPEATIGKWMADYSEQRQIVRDTASYLSALHSIKAKPSFQDRVALAHGPLFSDDPTDVAERSARFFEESNETCQAFGMTREEAHALVDYVYGRPVGEPAKEIGAASLTLTSLCIVAGYDRAGCEEADLEKLVRPETIARIRAKRATRHGRGALPGFDPSATEVE